MRRARAVARGGGRGLEHRTSEMNQVQLNNLRVLLHVPPSISMRLPTRDELFHDAFEANNEIPFPVAAVECGVRLPLTPLLRQLLSDIPLHPMQVSPTLWENLLALIIMWHTAHAQNPSLEELQACFRLRSPHKMSGSYYPYNTGGRLLRKEYKTKSWASRWFFLGGAWKAPTGKGA